MEYVFIAIIFLLVAAVASLIGIGGGVIYVPILLLMGYSFHAASPVSLFLIAITGFSAFLRYRKANLVDWKLAIVMEIFTDMGSFTGGITSVHFNPMLLKIMFSIILLVLAFITIKGKTSNAKKGVLKQGFGHWVRQFNGESYSIPIFLMIPITFISGYLSGLLGIAGGMLKIPVMILWFNIPVKIAIATSALMVSITAITGLAGHLINTNIDWTLALILAGVVFIGGQVGSRISVKVSEKVISKVVGYVFVAMAIFMIIQTVFLDK
ncbi:MAG: sulfite exporter TauE/SafE family protein [Bacteroidales bacterium]|nr:sulfite exporter TauE/SafE family protein [Bacteroidales bacterium]HPD95010.1 sulfite exporter TauE/SafE family protein [Tenuifilaceae bacterium]